MKFTLKQYQEDAVADVLDNLRKASKRWHEDKDHHAFSLTATTGAGKTVMAAAAFEALFFGSDEFDFEPEPGAVVIWFSDDPSLNEQSRFRLMEASDKLTVSDLITVDNTFSRERFEPGKIYFLNTQKFAKHSTLVRGHDAFDHSQETLDGRRIMPDGRSHTIWDTIQNTIEDPDLTLYLVLDEAHRGMGATKAKGEQLPTIVKTLINGHGAVPAIPVVWGISATVERFDDAVKGMQKRATLPDVVVDPALVQESGLLKDTINLDVPSETGNFSTVLLRRGTEKLKEITHAWESYVAEQNLAESVAPLMVLQMPNTPNHDEIGEWLQTIFDAWPDLPRDCVANVFGEHRTERFGAFEVPYLPPERIQETDWIRILIAKDAISTGWDCPRAEVMVSFRPARDRTHITQLLGRMVRAPLARRIPGHERLNAVDCLLPHFDRQTVEAVVQALMTGDESGAALPGRRVLINPAEMLPNPDVTDDVWNKFKALPSQVVPRGQPRPIKRLTALAHELAADGLLPDAGKFAHGELHKALDTARKVHAAKIKEACNAVLRVEGQAVTADLASGSMSFQNFVEAADYVVIEDAYRRAGRVLTADIARTYSEYLAESDEGDVEDALIEAHTIVAGIGLVPEVGADLEQAADGLAAAWLEKHANDILLLSDERQEAYRQLRELSAMPVDVDLAVPKSWLQPTFIRHEDGREEAVPTYEKHLMCDETGLFPEYFISSWEPSVVATECARHGFLAWYRNPGRPTQDSLGVSYLEDGDAKTMRPDFIFFARKGGEVVADLVDPHGHHLADSLPKLRGLAMYAEVHGANFRRIESVADVDGTLRVLDLMDVDVRRAIAEATSAKAAFASDAARDYN